MLQDYPKLKNLTIHEFDGHGIGDDDWMTPLNVFVPKCLSSQLKTGSLIGYKARTLGLNF